jgi:hypothetical protein
VAEIRLALLPINLSELRTTILPRDLTNDGVIVEGGPSHLGEGNSTSDTEFAEKDTFLTFLYIFIFVADGYERSCPLFLREDVGQNA